MKAFLTEGELVELLVNSNQGETDKDGIDEAKTGGWVAGETLGLPIIRILWREKKALSCYLWQRTSSEELNSPCLLRSH